MGRQRICLRFARVHQCRVLQRVVWSDNLTGQAHITLTREQGDGAVAAKVGDLLSIELASNPGGAGYSWTLEPQHGALLELVESQFLKTSEATGSGGVQRLTLRALAAGDARVRLKYWRPWEGEKSVIDRFDVKVDIQ